MELPVLYLSTWHHHHFHNNYYYFYHHHHFHNNINNFYHHHRHHHEHNMPNNSRRPLCQSGLGFMAVVDFATSDFETCPKYQSWASFINKSTTESYYRIIYDRKCNYNSHESRSDSRVHEFGSTCHDRSCLC